MTLPGLRFIAQLRHFRFRARRQPMPGDAWPLTLADVPPGQQAEIESFLAGLSDERQAHLRAYGLAPGHRVQVKQHQPVTVVQVDHTELAIENELARQVGIKQIP